MGKCSKCGKRIEYNAFVVIDGKVYCPACVVEKAKEANVISEEDIEVAKAEVEAEDLHESIMAGHGNDPEEQTEPEKKPKKKRSKKKPTVPEFYGGDEKE